MPRFAGFLRAVNLGGNTRLPMVDLRRALERAGFEGVTTVLQSGNVVFEAAGPGTDPLEQRIERLLLRAFDLRTEVFVRSAEEWRAVVDQNPFRGAARDDPSHLTVLALKAAPSIPAWTGLTAGISGREQVRSAGRHGYLVYPDGIGTSRLTLERIERALGTKGTLRNWNTVRKVDALLTA
jgi:uncharacterized protein (DUF1697 family)